MDANGYRVVIEPLSDEDGGGFLATVPELPGCMSDGDSRQESLANVEDAIATWIACVAYPMKLEVHPHLLPK